MDATALHHLYTDPAVLWPALLGLCLLVAGLVTYGGDVRSAASRPTVALAALGPVFVAASLAAFAGEHFTAAASLAQLVPKWLPGRLFIAYFVGVAHLAAALSFIAKRYTRWSSICLAIMFGLFVLLMDLPAAVTHPTIRFAWSLAAREATFAMGAVALFATDAVTRSPRASRTLVGIARIWTAGVLVFYGVEHVLSPQYAPGVPSSVVTAAWVPIPSALALATGVLLVTFGVAMLVEKRAGAAAALCGLLMLLLTLALYVPQFFLAASAGQQVTAINFIFDTLLFAGTLLVVSRAIMATQGSTAVA